MIQCLCYWLCQNLWIKADPFIYRFFQTQAILVKPQCRIWTSLLSLDIFRQGNISKFKHRHLWRSIMYSCIKIFSWNYSHLQKKQTNTSIRLAKYHIFYIYRTQADFCYHKKYVIFDNTKFVTKHHKWSDKFKYNQNKI